MTAVIDARDVFVLYHAAYGDVAALRGLSLTVEEGQTVAVLGPSGAGKSTLLDLCATQQRPSSGQVTVLGTALDKASTRQLDRLRRTQIGIVRQHYDRALPRELTVTEIVALPLRLAGHYHRQSGGWVDQLLTAAGLRHRASARPGQLSGGEQQRVAVCAALVTRPRLLLADEPTGELDPRTSAALLDTMLDLTRTVEATALIVTHDPAVADRSDRVIHIRDGRLAAEGSVKPTLVLDRQGWLRLPESLRETAGFHDQVTASASWSVIELRAKDPRQKTAPHPQARERGRNTDVGGVVEVSLDRVSKRYRAAADPVLSELTHSFARHRLHVIAGASGSGKTTLLNLIAALERPAMARSRHPGSASTRLPPLRPQRCAATPSAT
ncbi:MAG: ATP-binding cassette domain-containing protein [Streptosporangiaceae bacterium]